MRSYRPIASVIVTGVLAAGLVVGAVPAPALATPETTLPRVSTSSELPNVPVALPSVRARALGAGTVTIGKRRDISWSDERFDASLRSYYTLLTIANAVEGRDYRLTLNGAGPLSAFVLDAQAEPVAYAGHPDATLAAPTLEWQYRTGDQILLISDELPLASPTASLLVTELSSAQTPWLPYYFLDPDSGMIAGTLSPTDPHLPFHGGHVDQRWYRPTQAAPGQGKLVLAFEGDSEDTDWLSVVVLDSELEPVDEIPVESGVASFRIAADESFVVTSYAPDEFGSYTFSWMMPGTPQVAGVSDPYWWEMAGTTMPTYRVEWRWGGAVRTLSSAGFPATRITHRIEVSADGRTWKRAVVGRPAEDVFAFATGVVLADGRHWLRVVTQVGDAQGVSAAFPFQASGDERGWRITSLRITRAPKLMEFPGEDPHHFDMSNVVTATEVYRDGRRRTRTLPVVPAVMYRFPTGEWRANGEDQSRTVFYWSGHFRVQTHDGSVRSNVYPITVPQATGARRATLAPPARSTTVGGAMVFSGTISRQFTDKWRPVHDRTWYEIQHRSGKRWVTIYTGRTKSNGKGELQATVPLAGPGSYRMTVGGAAHKVMASWKLKPAQATKTAKVAKPTVKKSSKGTHAVVVDIDQKFSDGRWGPARFGWKYQIQHRTIGAKMWKSTSAKAVPQSSPFEHKVKAKGKAEFRVKATYRGKAYYSPITKG